MTQHQTGYQHPKVHLQSNLLTTPLATASVIESIELQTFRDSCNRFFISFFLLQALLREKTVTSTFAPPSKNDSTLANVEQQHHCKFFLVLIMHDIYSHKISFLTLLGGLIKETLLQVEELVGMYRQLFYKVCHILALPQLN